MGGKSQDLKLVETLAKLTQEIAKLTESHRELRKDVQAIYEASNVTAEKCEKIDKKLEKLEADNFFFGNQLRANNIVIYNFPEEEKQSMDLCTLVFNLFKKIDIPIPEIAVSDVFRLGKKTRKSYTSNTN